MKQNPHNIYIHVPFCMSKCNYCAFFSRACIAPDWDKYADDICSEIVQWGTFLEHCDVPTIFFGGGTPSLMPVATFEKIINTIQQNFNLIPNAEITLESNPGTLTATRLSDFISAGVNRLSVGIQSLDDNKLKFLGRRHSAHDAIELINHAQNMKIRVSGDFIYGLPHETPDDIVQTCNQINDLGLSHCSMYELTIEENTPFGKMNLEMPNNETMAQMYIAINDTLRLPRYEVSNYATPGHECQHNQNVWNGEPYVGIGTGAAGRILVSNQWYEQRGGGAQFEKISDNTRAIETLITAMRTIRGCELTDVIKNVIDMDWIFKNPELIQIKNNRIMATNSGLLILDDIMPRMVK